MPPGQVIRTDPPAGQTVPLDTRINIYVSRARRRCSCRARSARPRPTPEADLESKGFTVSTLNQVDDANVGKVVTRARDPTRRSTQEQVVLTIGIASTSPSTGTTSTTGPTTGTT